MRHFILGCALTNVALTCALHPVPNPVPRRVALSLLGGATLQQLYVPHPSLAASVSSEPPAAARLLALVAGRKPTDWRADERAAVDALIEELVAAKAPWRREALYGKWRLAYLQPGPGGAGVDRRVPFPELPFNEQYQRFGADGTLTNIGQLLGPALEVRVSGTLREDDPRVELSPKRFVATIDRGALCLGETSGAPCAPLPISGEGLFDGVFLGEQIRIGQNLNGGGARIVQVRTSTE